MKSINTVTGTTTAEQLGTTLMHEHLLIGWAGWELDCAAPKFERRAAFKNAVDRLKELKDLGLQSFVDPCPMDIGRDVNFMAEVAEASGVRIVCATGLYKEDLGNTAYFKQRSVDEIAEAPRGARICAPAHRSPPTPRTAPWAGSNLTSSHRKASICSG